ncbi:MAG TPA: ABC transporter substrate-binding protein [Streptosporangiaceae bacterium]|jgi:osmoprotectant transport system substrate-binding protein
MRKLIGLTSLGAAALLALSACGGGTPAAQSTAKASSGTVTVGSANFPENVLLGEIYAQAMEGKGVKVEKKLNIGSREVYFRALKRGELSMLPEYNGALLTYLDPKATAVTTAETNTALKAKLPSGMALLDSAQAEDKDSVVVTKATAQKDHLTTLADLKPVAGKMVFGGPPEFKTRKQGIVGLKSEYGINFKSFKSLDTAGPITVSALSKGQIQAANLFTTDPAVLTKGFVVLKDPKNLFGAQNVTPVVNDKLVPANAKQVMNQVSAKLTTPELVAMMKKVNVDKDDPSDVAKQWLKDQSL